MYLIRGEDALRHLRESGSKRIKPGAYSTFVAMGKIQKHLKAKQRQQEQQMLLRQAYLSFVISFFIFFNFCAKVCINFYLCKGK